MSIQTIPAFLYMQHETKFDAIDYSFSESWRPDVWTVKVDDNAERIFIREITLTVEAPDDFDPVPMQVAVLQAEREALTAKFTAALQENADKLQKLLAITNEVTA